MIFWRCRFLACRLLILPCTYNAPFCSLRHFQRMAHEWYGGVLIACVFLLCVQPSPMSEQQWVLFMGVVNFWNFTIVLARGGGDGCVHMVACTGMGTASRLHLLDCNVERLQAGCSHRVLCSCCPVACVVLPPVWTAAPLCLSFVWGMRSPPVGYPVTRGALRHLITAQEIGLLTIRIGDLGGAPCAVLNVGRSRPVFPDGHGDCGTTVFPDTRLFRFLLSPKIK